MHSGNSSPSPTGRQPARVVVLYDDYLTAARGLKLVDGISHEMGLEDNCAVKLWHVDLLDSPLAGAAPVETAEADLLLVILRSASKFSPYLKMWLRRWLNQTRYSSAALIAVFESDGERAGAAAELQTFFATVAHSSGRDFFRQMNEHVPAGLEGHEQECFWII